jgi:hypothetical protein
MLGFVIGILFGLVAGVILTNWALYAKQLQFLEAMLGSMSKQLGYMTDRCNLLSERMSQQADWISLVSQRLDVACGDAPQDLHEQSKLN